VDVGQLGAVAVMPPTHEICDLVEQLGHGELCSFGPEGIDKARADAGPLCRADEVNRNV
jgi:hypothetical protein